MGLALNHSFFTPEALEHCLTDLESFTAFSSEQVLRLASQAKTLAEAQTHQPGLAKSLYFLALYYDAHDQVDACLSLTLQALELQSYLDVAYQIKVLNLLASSYYFSGQNHATLLHAGKALALNSNVVDSKAAASSHSYLARAYIELGIYELALEHFHEWCTLSEKCGEETISTALYSMAVLHHRMENYDDALPYYLQSLAVAQQTSDRYLEATILSSLAELSLIQKDYDKALSHALNAVSLLEQLQDSHELIFAWVMVADIYVARGQHDQALQHYLQGLEHLKQFPSAGVAELNLRVGNLYMSQHDTDNARTYFEEALVAAPATDSLETLSNTHKALGLFYEQTNELKLALEHYKTFYAVQGKKLKEASNSRSKAMLIKFEVERLRQEQEHQRLKTLELTSLVYHLEELSSRDALTGLYNRRFFDTYLQRHLEESAITENPLCLVLADVDNFKKINDTFSHGVGDEVLKIISSIFLNTLRGSDCVARYGGEEVVVLFTDTSLDKALLVCEKTRHRIEAYPWEKLRPSLRVTISMGVSDSYGLGQEKLLEDADAKLYQAKREGKNRVKS
jgi:diguanylate cyclase (GGDEF)-like protein